MKKVRFALAKNLSDILAARKLRNECKNYLTNYKKGIGLLKQIYWYFSYYTNSVDKKTYRVYLAKNRLNTPIGYGALTLKKNVLFVTECVSEKYRGQGYGKAILQKLIEIGELENRCLAAEILATNEVSKNLHLKLGFVLDKKKLKSKNKLLFFRKNND